MGVISPAPPCTDCCYWAIHQCSCGVDSPRHTISHWWIDQLGPWDGSEPSLLRCRCPSLECVLPAITNWICLMWITEQHFAAFRFFSLVIWHVVFLSVALGSYIAQIQSQDEVFSSEICNIVCSFTWTFPLSLLIMALYLTAGCHLMASRVFTRRKTKPSRVHWEFLTVLESGV